MKYIKTFENIDEDLEKYIAIKFTSNIIVAEIIRFNSSGELIVRRLYNKHENSKHLDTFDKEDKKEMLVNYENIKNRIVYQTNDLQQLLDILDSLFYVSKYNL